jgi:hypothetical protein
MNTTALTLIGIAVVLVAIMAILSMIKSRVTGSRMDSPEYHGELQTNARMNCPECHDGPQPFPCETCDGAGSISSGHNSVPTRNYGTSNSLLRGLVQRGGRWEGFK